MKTEEEISKLESKLMALGLSGMAYTPIWNEIAKELNRLKEKK